MNALRASGILLDSKIFGDLTARIRTQLSQKAGDFSVMWPGRVALTSTTGDILSTLRQQCARSPAPKLRAKRSSRRVSHPVYIRGRPAGHPLLVSPFPCRLPIDGLNIGFLEAIFLFSCSRRPSLLWPLICRNHAPNSSGHPLVSSLPRRFLTEGFKVRIFLAIFPFLHSRWPYDLRFSRIKITHRRTPSPYKKKIPSSLTE